jgi:hypothetical protein
MNYERDKVDAQERNEEKQFPQIPQIYAEKKVRRDDIPSQEQILTKREKQ